MFAYRDICIVPCRFRAAVHGEMFRGRNYAIVFGIVTLHACYEGHAHARREIGVFAVGLLTAAPTWITKDVDIRGPEIQAFEDIAMPRAHSLHMLDASFD